jgi:hypothetical protein
MKPITRLIQLLVFAGIAYYLFFYARILTLNSTVGVIVTVVILFFISRGLKRVFKPGSNDSYRRLDMWIAKRIGRVDKEMSESRLREKLNYLYKDELARLGSEKKVSGLKSYIDSSAYRSLLKK